MACYGRVVYRNEDKAADAGVGWRSGIEGKGLLRHVYIWCNVEGKEGQGCVVIAVGMFAICLFSARLPRFYLPIRSYSSSRCISYI
jgi:hypothetical protein